MGAYGQQKSVSNPQQITIDTRAASYMRDQLIDTPDILGQGSNARAVFPLGNQPGRFAAFGQRQKVPWNSKHSIKYCNRANVDLVTDTANASFDIHRPLTNCGFGDIRPRAKDIDKWNRPDWKINNFDQHLGYRNQVPYFRKEPAASSWNLHRPSLGKNMPYMNFPRAQFACVSGMSCSGDQ